MRKTTIAALLALCAMSALSSCAGGPAAPTGARPGAAAALPKVAVLDAIVAEGIDPSVAGIITESVMEPLVSSGKYVVLDRKYISQSLSEHEFQLSSLVSSKEITEVGAFLGAKYIVVIDVSRSLGVYSVVGKMIDVETSAIVSQKSERRQAQEKDLFAMAQSLGEKLSGKAGASDEGKASPSEAATAAPALEPKSAPAAKPSAAPAAKATAPAAPSPRPRAASIWRAG